MLASSAVSAVAEMSKEMPKGDAHGSFSLETQKAKQCLRIAFRLPICVKGMDVDYEHIMGGPLLQALHRIASLKQKTRLLQLIALELHHTDAAVAQHRVSIACFLHELFHVAPIAQGELASHSQPEVRPAMIAGQVLPGARPALCSGLSYTFAACS